MKLTNTCVSAFFLFAFHFASTSQAQPVVQLLNLKAQHSPSTPYVNDSETNLKTTQYQGSFLLPVEQKNNDVVLAGGDYTQINFTGEGNTNGRSSLHSASLLVGFEKRLGDKWKAAVIALPKISSDFQDISGDDWQMGGIAMATYVRNKNLKYKFGVYYNRECFGDYVMPLVGIDWKVNERLNVFGDLPANMNVEFKVCKSLYTGVAYNSIVSSYRVSSPEGNQYVRVGDKTFGQNDFKAYVNCYITRHFVWYAEGGYTAGRMYQLYNDNGEAETETGLFRQTKDGAFVNTGIAFCFRLDEQ